MELICGVFSGLGGRWFRAAGPDGAGGSRLTASADAAVSKQSGVG